MINVNYQMYQYNKIQMSEYENFDGLKELYTSQKGLRKYMFLWVYPLINFKGSLNFENIPAIHNHDSAEWNFSQFKSEMQGSDQYQHMKAFYCIVWRNYKFYWLALLVLQTILSAVSAMNPIVVNAIIQLFENQRPNYPLFIRTYVFFMGYLIILMLGSPAANFINGLMSVKLSGALKGLIVDKTLRVTYPLPAQGDMVNLMTVDVTQVCQLMATAINLIMTPFQLLLSIYVYFNMLGTPAFVGIIGLSFQFMFNIFYAWYYAKMQVSIMNCKDARMRSINEMLYGINTIKQNGYYGFFSKKIANRRQEEMANIKNQQLLTLLISLISGYGFPIAVIYFTFKMFDIFSLSNVIAVQQNYFSLVWIINSVPGLISTMLVGGVSLKRIMNFFYLEDLEVPKLFAKETDSVIEVQDGSFKWHQSVQCLTSVDYEEMDHHFQLQGITMKIKKGEQILIVGGTGSGKSSMLYAILGELNSLNGKKFKVNGDVSIATQEPWITQTSLLQNIIHQEEIDEDRLLKVLETTQLATDLISMQSGINTEVGENGATLSGGQRKRVHLSRALYQKKSIYLLDSPLSALDPKVAFQVGKNISQFLKGQTVVIFSNSTDYWEDVDRVYYLEDGKITKEGPPQQQKQTIKIDDLNLLITNQKEEGPQLTYQLIDKQRTNMVDQEDRQHGNIPLNVFKNLSAFFGGWPLFIGCGTLSLCGMGLNLYYQQYLSNLTGIAARDDVSDDEKQRAADKYLIIFPILYMGQALFSLGKSLALLLKGVQASVRLHGRIIENLLRASVQKYYNLILASRVKNRMSNDIYLFDMNTSSNISSVYDNLFSLLAVLVATFIFSTVYTYPFQLIFILLVVYFAIKYIKTMVELNRIMAISISPMLNAYQEIWQGMLYIRHCTDIEQVKSNFFSFVDENNKAQLAIYYTQQWFNQITNAIMLFIYTAMLVSNYEDLSLNEQQASIALYMSVSLSEQFFNSVSSFQSFYTQIVYFQRCNYLMTSIPREDEADVQEEAFQLQIEGDAASEVELATIQSLNLEQIASCALRVQGISAKYRPDLPYALQDVSFVIDPKEKIAVIGRTGSGKTSLIQCITRLITHDTGQIVCFGRNYNDSSIDEVRANFSVISQDPFLFEGTIQQNIDPLGIYASEQEIRYVIAQFSPKEIGLLSKMSDRVDELGKNLSLGERQLIVLIRIMLQQRRMVILDECTGSLDKAYSALIQGMLNSYLKDKTVINVTHKLESVRDCDKVILIDNGRLQLMGGVEEVIRFYQT